jgi:leucyl-tRNA synthetase
VHKTLEQASYDYERMQYNTVVSACMKLLNALEKLAAGPDAAGRAAAITEAFGIALRVLYPACPHITHALWHELGYAADAGDLLDAPWPEVDAAALVRDEIELVLQVNGKLRGAIRVPASADKAQIEAAALASAEFERYAEGRAPKKVIVVPGRLVNVVV